MRRFRVVLITLGAAGVAAAGALGGATAATPPSNTSPPSISGTTQRTQTLAAQSGSWSGTTPIAFAYQWRRCSSSGGDCGNIGGASSPTYTLGSSDVGRTVRVQVTASNSAGSAQAVSGATAVVTTTAPPVNTSAPGLSGTAQDGHTLTVSNGGWRSDTSLSYSYRWLRCDGNGNGCGSISGATHSSYKASSADVGHRLRATVTARNSAGSTPATSSASDVVRAAGVAPQTTQRPSLTGAPKVGQTLTVTGGSWSGTQPIALAFRWLRCGVNGAAPCDTIGGATLVSYTLATADLGHTIQAFVTATNVYGSNETNTPPTATVVPAGPAGAVNLPNGRTSIPVSSVALPVRLVVAGVSFSPNRIRTRARGTTVTVRVVDTRGYVVRDALVSVTAYPTTWARRLPERRTAANGTVTFRLQPTARLPLVPRGWLAVYVHVRKPGENPLAGVSSGRMFQVALGG